MRTASTALPGGDAVTSFSNVNFDRRYSRRTAYVHPAGSVQDAVQDIRAAFVVVLETGVSDVLVEASTSSDALDSFALEGLHAEIRETRIAAANPRETIRFRLPPTA
jgi:hypothetical protein